ncbi:hypothetical protein LTR36_006712 [Oleoguttula mirabilis]|uniref:Domain of unknown function at the cortex 1 domain-containing protein n=1 Tax=Oleoguttula mirabilis TaxID=1507867 RepID=A0AAV9JBX5_9PEZI|nr:hypothetical protein LTR36_006712 [Oleoguttula mirabilis]
MASALKAKIASAATSSSTPDLSSQEAEKYKLLVTAGPSYDQSTHHTIRVNTDEPTYIENTFLRAKISVKIRAYRGLPSSSPSHSPYFDDPVHEKDLYSISFSFVPKVDLPSVDTVWGNDFDHPVRDRLPPGFNTAFKIVKEFIDPGLQCDAYADAPWLYGPSLSCWFAFRVGDIIADEHADFPAPQEGGAVMKEGADGSGATIRRNLGIPDSSEKRRKHFLSAAHREAFTFEKGRCYHGDFYNPYIDFGNFALKLPGFSLKVIKYVDQKSHCLRYVFKNRMSGDMYFNLNFHLLWGEKLERAMREDGEGLLGRQQQQQQQQRQQTDGALDTVGDGDGGEAGQVGDGQASEAANGHDGTKADVGAVEGDEQDGDQTSVEAAEAEQQRRDSATVPTPSPDQEGVNDSAQSTAHGHAAPEAPIPPEFHPSDHSTSTDHRHAGNESKATPGAGQGSTQDRPENHRRYGNHDCTASSTELHHKRDPTSDEAECREADDEITRLLVATSTGDRRDEKYL